MDGDWTQFNLGVLTGYLITFVVLTGVRLWRARADQIPVFFADHMDFDAVEGELWANPPDRRGDGE